MAKKILISGHRGNIGRRLADRLRIQDYEVLGVDIKDGVDCADPTNLHSFKGVDVIFHLAAHLKYPKRNTMDACDGILEFAKQEEARLVYASSAAIYNANNMYAIHKLYGEGLFHSELDNVIALRLFNVYGGNGIGLIDKIEKGEHIEINGSGIHRRDYVHIDDVVEAFSKAGETEITGSYDIGTGVTHSVMEVLKMFNYLDYEHVDKPGGVLHSQADINKRFPWHPTISLEEYAKA